ncbi:MULTISPECIES: hypothetical protein [unclassified Variovorax]|uniref:hypothetical protein n=1 Tax=unclassified Variovorax TaxID=663243 RepID=UPI003ECC736F
MSLGTQYVAPNGYRDLQQGCTYHVLMNDAATERVALVCFETNSSEPRAFPHFMTRSYFEQGVDTGELVKEHPQARLPSWLSPREEGDLKASDSHRRAPKKAHRGRIEAKLASIGPAIQILKEILRSEDPDHLLNKFARACKPRVKAVRFRLWFYAYLAFGKNELALHYRTGNLGKWSRDENTSAVKRGTPGKKGKGHGFNANPMAPDMMVAYEELKGLGVGQNQIYTNAAVQYFGCHTRLRGGYREFFHPDGHAFPSRNEFWYHVNKSRGKASVREDKIGKTKERAENAPFRGSFTANVSNLMERVETDAYVMKEAPIDFLNEGLPLKPIRVVRRRDVRSGTCTGLGFSLGSETASAYRTARFCEAVGIGAFGALFGLDVKGRCVPGGISPNDVQDRGPGSSDEAFSRDPEFQPVFNAIAPSGAAQSKAVIEASHPRSSKDREGPTYIPSKKNVCQLIKEEILRAVSDNEKMDVQSRVPDDLLARVNPPTSINLWRELDRLERNDAIPITFDEALRSFLTKVDDAKFDRHGIVLHGRVFGSRAFDASGVRDRVSREQSPKVDVYVLETCVRHIWIDVHGKVIQLDMQVPYRCGDEELYVSLEELKERERFISQSTSRVEEHKLATSAQLSIDAEAATGVKLGTGRRRKGAPKRRKGVSRSEGIALKKILRGK